MSLYDQSQVLHAGTILKPVKTPYDTLGPIPDVNVTTTPSAMIRGEVKTIQLTPQTNDVINSPKHYARGKFEVWDIIEFFKLNYNLGNVCKYILRAGVKTASPLEDYKKARAYLDREIAILEGRIDVRPK